MVLVSPLFIDGIANSTVGSGSVKMGMAADQYYRDSLHLSGPNTDHLDSFLYGGVAQLVEQRHARPGLISMLG